MKKCAEALLSKGNDSKRISIVELPVSDWVNMISEGKVECVGTRRIRKTLKTQFYQNQIRK